MLRNLLENGTSQRRPRRIGACLALAVTLGAGASSIAFAQELQRSVPLEDRSSNADSVPEAGMPNERGSDIREDVPELGERISNLFGGGEDASGSGGPAPEDVAAACNRTDLNADQMRELQTELGAIWGDAMARPGPADGICGPRTLRSVTMFQRAQGMPDDGVPTMAVLERAREVRGDAGGSATPAATSSTPEARPAVPSSSSSAPPVSPPPSATTAPDTTTPAAPSTPDAPSMSDVPATPETPRVPSPPPADGAMPGGAPDATPGALQPNNPPQQ
ncbi:peptidoglycan-binding domain-containing protein [Marinivivus vitaminiproducens]|uniref:peptidoglycan-binding domain-containing protein n=1 Tax=Marinivivus vitaminiproducens TaxID=3035935 RepID=UPI00279B1159|nr:peptidoglycan-binding domain-containing protein [Geminicoccaceae bacterium SCSIO 64248]